MSHEPSRPERILASFASLLSSALTATGETPEALADSASTLPRLISDGVKDDVTCCTVPCLMLKHNDSSSRSATSLEQTAALYLARPLALTRVELEAAPVALLGNLSESFMFLVDSRLRSSLAALLRQSEKQQDSSLTHMLVGLLSNPAGTISPTAVVTSFRVLPVSDVAQNGDHVAPLIMETVVDLEILQELVTVTVVAPGTIQGTFGPIDSDGKLTRVEIVLDTASFLQSLMKQARFAVRKAIAIASGVASKLIVSSLEADSTTTSQEHTQTDSAVPDGLGPSSMMPPPRRLPHHQAQQSRPDLPTSHEKRGADSNKNATWDSQGLREDGLSILTAAAVGLKRPNNTSNPPAASKRQHVDTTTTSSIMASNYSSISTGNANNGRVDAIA